jgi:hypothetical protein
MVVVSDCNVGLVNSEIFALSKNCAVELVLSFFVSDFLGGDVSSCWRRGRSKHRRFEFQNPSKARDIFKKDRGVIAKKWSSHVASRYYHHVPH